MRILSGFALFLCLAPSAFAGPVSLGTFAVTGTGSFSCDQIDATAEYTFSLSGANANYTLQASSIGLGGSYTFTSHLTFPCLGSSVGENSVIADNLPLDFDPFAPLSIVVTPAALGGFDASTDMGTFQLGNGTGFLNIYDNASAQPGNPANLIATASLIGYVTVNSVQSFGPPDPGANGTFAITPTGPGTEMPEPNAGVLVLMAALWPAARAAACSLRRRIRSR